VLSNEAQAFRAFVGSVVGLGHALLKHGDRANEPFGQTSARWRVLLRIAAGEGSVPAIARSTGYSRQATQRLADALVADGLAEFRPDETDRRRQGIVLTDSGRAMLDRMEASYDVWAQRLVTSIGHDELERLITGLERVRSIVENDRPLGES
jgi:DNA-binding MarR family transcriptional regulator